MNQVTLTGGLVRPPELRYTQGGWPFAQFTIAVAGTRWDAKEGKRIVTTSFIGCEMAGPRAEQLAEELDGKKGEELYVFGELDQSEWTDDQGKKQSRTRVRVLLYERLSPRDGVTEREKEVDDGPDESPY